MKLQVTCSSSSMYMFGVGRFIVSGLYGAILGPCNYAQLRNA